VVVTVATIAPPRIFSRVLVSIPWTTLQDFMIFEGWPLSSAPWLEKTVMSAMTSSRTRVVPLYVEGTFFSIVFGSTRMARSVWCSFGLKKELPA